MLTLPDPSVSWDHADLELRQADCLVPDFLRVNEILSFWRTEVEFLQETDQKQEEFLTSQLLTDACTFACK